MARCLIIGCGCHGRELARELQARGHVVRGTSRQSSRLVDIERVGAEAVQADPDRLATLVPALEHVGIVIVLLGSAGGDRDSVSALHGPRLEALMAKLLDTTVRGIVYEAAGSVPQPLLRGGQATIERLGGISRIPHGFIDVPRDDGAWKAHALEAVAGVLAPL